MQLDRVLSALEGEGGRLAEVMLGLAEEQFDRPTRCRPWSIKELLAHLLVASNRLPTMLDAPPPPEATVTAAGYYRPDERFGSEASRARIAAATADAATSVSGHALAMAVDAALKEMASLARAEPAGRLVRTRWGDAMALSDFLVTRVAELGIHGLDLADGLGSEPWLTPEAADIIEGLLLDDAGIESVRSLGWNQITLIETATGRRSPTDGESEALAQRGVRWLTFG